MPVVRDRHLFFSTYILPTVKNMHGLYNIPPKIPTISPQNTIFAKKSRKMEGNAYVNFCTRLRLVRSHQISEIACTLKIGELVSNLAGKFRLTNSLIYSQIWICTDTLLQLTLA
jgi:hypothetical protein